MKFQLLFPKFLIRKQGKYVEAENMEKAKQKLSEKYGVKKSLLLLREA